MKFDNSNYMKFNNKSKLLAGLFVSSQKLLSREVKNSKNIYRTLMDIGFVEYNNKIQESFGKNSNNGEIRFSSNYDSANLFIALKVPLL